MDERNDGDDEEGVIKKEFYNDEIYDKAAADEGVIKKEFKDEESHDDKEDANKIIIKREVKDEQDEANDKVEAMVQKEIIDEEDLCVISSADFYTNTGTSPPFVATIHVNGKYIGNLHNGGIGLNPNVPFIVLPVHGNSENVVVRIRKAAKRMLQVGDYTLRMPKVAREQVQIEIEADRIELIVDGVTTLVREKETYEYEVGTGDLDRQNELLYEAWRFRCTRMVNKNWANIKRIHQFPAPPLPGKIVCEREECVRGETERKLLNKACKHTVERLFRDGEADSKGLLTFADIVEFERKRWHPDRFRFVRGALRRRILDMAIELFNIIFALKTDGLEVERIKTEETEDEGSKSAGINTEETKAENSKSVAIKIEKIDTEEI